MHLYCERYLDYIQQMFGLKLKRYQFKMFRKSTLWLCIYELQSCICRAESSFAGESDLLLHILFFLSARAPTLGVKLPTSCFMIVIHITNYWGSTTYCICRLTRLPFWRDAFRAAPIKIRTIDVIFCLIFFSLWIVTRHEQIILHKSMEQHMQSFPKKKFVLAIDEEFMLGRKVSSVLFYHLQSWKYKAISFT